MKTENKPAAANFKFGIRQVVRHNKELGTVIGRAEHASGEPTYLVREIESQSLTHGASYRESQLIGV